MTILNSDEKQTIETLNIKQIITKYPKLLIKIRKSTNSYVEMLSELGVSTTNTSARKSIKAFLEEHNLQVPNYRLYQSSPEYSLSRKATLSKEEVLSRFVAGDRHIGTQLRKWVIEHDLLPYKCSVEGCILATNETNIMWNGKVITLDLDHINGDNTDNRLKNLRWLCPNCHSQTETYKEKNKRIKNKPVLEKSLEARRKAYEALPTADDLWEEIKKIGMAEAGRKYNVPRHSLKIKLLEYTGTDELVEKIKSSTNRTQLNTNGKYLAEPAKKASYPPIETIVARVISEGYEGLARELGISGNAIRKYLKSRLGYAPKRGGANPIT